MMVTVAGDILVLCCLLKVPKQIWTSKVYAEQ